MMNKRSFLVIWWLVSIFSFSLSAVIDYVDINLETTRTNEVINSSEFHHVNANETDIECDCGKNSTYCKFENGHKQCSCEPGFTVGNYGFCTPMCSDTKKCANGGLCLQDVCVCLASTGGTFCEIVYDCEEKKCGEDKNVCKYDTHNQKAYCECSGKYDKFDPYDKSCKRCDCGVHSTCDFDSDGKKVCHCNKGFKERLGTCYKCDCGDYGTCIGFDKLFANRTNVCVCRPGYEAVNGICRRCPCGENGKCVYFSSSGDFNKCNCDAGYVEWLNECKLCDCGIDSKCKFKRGTKVCDCPRGYENWKGYCADINECWNSDSCPKLGTVCVNTPGSFRCECKPGYFASLPGQTYTSKLQCTKYDSLNYKPWKIGYGVLSGGFILIIIGLVIIIFKIRRNSAHNQADIPLGKA